ncbi:MAG: acetoin utilization protein AcuC [Anaerolineales bacterium]|nr:acetoin utilization protein AcuC [Anaerolineales bacterium]
MNTRKSVFLYSPALEKYPFPPDHPFTTSRAPKTRELIKSMGWLSGGDQIEFDPPPAERTVMETYHTARYLDALRRASDGDWNYDFLRMGIGTGDCPVFAGMYEHSVLAAGATLAGAARILEGTVDAAFNPHGGFHHAFPERAAGFCYVNDSVLGCLALAEAGKRVLYVDIDVHNGDGVAFAFQDRADVMTISFHENPRILFPGTGFEDEIGSGPGEGYCVNVPLPVGTYDEAYLSAFDEVVLPLMEAFGPDVLVMELGADGLAQDPLAHLQLTNNAYVEVLHRLTAAGKPILMTGGGGYNVENTVRAWALAWSVLSGQEDAGYASNAGMGGVMLSSTDWSGGLRDRELVIPDRQKEAVTESLGYTVRKVKSLVFPIHGLKP